MESIVKVEEARPPYRLMQPTSETRLQAFTISIELPALQNKGAGYALQVFAYLKQLPDARVDQ